MTTQTKVIIQCADPGCNTPVAEWQGDVLVIVARHHGDKHITVVAPKPSS